MKLSQYLSQQRAPLNRFEKWYTEMCESSPNLMLEEMNADHWQEQFEFFLTFEHELID